jgi:hypothetical protein
MRPAFASPTVVKPSVVYPPDGVKWLPLRLPGTHAQKGAGGAVAQIVELRGWLTFVGSACYRESPKTTGSNVNLREPDWHYNLELDPAWLDHLGIKDPNMIVRPGNVINAATRTALPGDTVGHETGPLATASPWAITARPIVHVEVTSWDPARHRGARPPVGWRAIALPGCAANVRWPYDPRNPVPGQPALAPGQYVRMVGSLVTDDPHVRNSEQTPDYASANREIHGILGGDDPVTLAVRLSWEQGRAETNPNNGARWSELHPPDRIDVLPPRPRTEEMRSVLVAVPSDLPAGKTYTLDTTLPLHHVGAPGTTPRVTEIIGPHTRPRATDRTSTPPPTTRVTITPAAVQLHIEVTRRGNPRTPSRFQATYRITS